MPTFGELYAQANRSIWPLSWLRRRRLKKLMPRTFDGLEAERKLARLIERKPT